MIELLEELKWWDYDKEDLIDLLPLLCNEDIAMVKSKIYKIILSNYYKRKNVILESEIFAINELIKQLVQQVNKSEDKNKNTLYGNSIYIKLQRDI